MHWLTMVEVFEAASQSSQMSLPDSPVRYLEKPSVEKRLASSPAAPAWLGDSETRPAVSLQKLTGSSPPLRKMFEARTTAYCAYGPVSPSKLRASLKSNAITEGLVNFSMK